MSTFDDSFKQSLLARSLKLIKRGFEKRLGRSLSRAKKSSPSEENTGLKKFEAKESLKKPDSIIDIDNSIGESDDEPKCVSKKLRTLKCSDAEFELKLSSGLSKHRTYNEYNSQNERLNLDDK
jgi:hypothetical protein